MRRDENSVLDRGERESVTRGKKKIQDCEERKGPGES